MRIHLNKELRLILSRSLFFACREVYFTFCQNNDFGTDLFFYLENQVGFSGPVSGWIYDIMGIHFRFAYDVGRLARTVNALMPEMEIHRRWWIYWVHRQIAKLSRDSGFPYLFLETERSQEPDRWQAESGNSAFDDYVYELYPRSGGLARYAQCRQEMWGDFIRAQKKQLY